MSMLPMMEKQNFLYGSERINLLILNTNTKKLEKRKDVNASVISEEILFLTIKSVCFTT